jgi:hypothetical protein
MKSLAHAVVASAALWLVQAADARAACTLPLAPVAAVAPGPAPNGNRLPIDAGPLIFSLNGSAIYPVTGSDGQVHLSFSATATNVTSAPVSISSLETLDASAGLPFGETRVVSMTGADLTLKAFRFSSGTGVADSGFSATLAPGEAGALYLDIAVAPGTSLPAYLALRLASTMKPPSGSPVAFDTTGTAMPVSCDPVIVLSPPLKGSGWVDGNGCCRIVSPHRWVLIPARGMQQTPEQFAIDFVKLDEAGRLYTGEITDPASWSGSRAVVVAAAAGMVIEVVDDLPNAVPGKDPPTVDTATAAGNHIIVDMGSDRYALYAHLDPGSILVEVGQRVDRGQLLAKLGNSGNTDAPHLHFHVTDRPSALDATGVPFVFDSTHLAGRVQGTGEAAVDALMKGAATTLDRAAASDKTKTMPLMLDVLNFR